MAFTPIDPNKAEVRITGTAPNYGLDFYIPKGERGDVGPVGPTGPATYTNLSVGIVETGPAPIATGPVGPQGVKGDPGGFSAPTTIAAGTNLNTIITAGLYQASGTSVLSANNYPITHDAPFQMSVYTSSTTTGMQIAEFNYAVRAGKVQYHRTWSGSGSVWTPWVSYSASRVDQTAGRVIYEWDDVNARDQIIYGDTGWRSIRTNIDSAYWDTTLSNVDIRRINQTVYLSADIKPLTANTTPSVGNAWYSTPVGFRPLFGGSRTDFVGYYETGSSNIPTPVIMRLNISNIDFLLGSRVANNISFIRVQAQWTTTDAWPTSLPGTAQGTIPNV